MNYNPYKIVKVLGSWTNRALTIEVPREQLAQMLPWGLEFDDQDLTQAGNHLLRFYFNAPQHAENNFPPVMGSDYYEQVIGIPHVRRTYGLNQNSSGQPLYYCPRLWLNQLLPTAGGLVWWGFAKRMAHIEYVDDGASGQFSVSKLENPSSPLIHAAWEPMEDWKQALQESDFDVHREILNQPMITRNFASLGPGFLGSRLEMDWAQAKCRRIDMAVTVSESFVPGLQPGTYMESGFSASSPLGSYELQCPWVLTLPYSMEVMDWVETMGDFFDDTITGITGGSR